MAGSGTTPRAERKELLSDSVGRYFCSARRLMSLGMPLCPRPFPLILIVSFSRTRRVRMKVDTLGSPSQTISLESQPKMRCLSIGHKYQLYLSPLLLETSLAVPQKSSGPTVCTLLCCVAKERRRLLLSPPSMGENFFKSCAGDL